mgnify:CR=1 FL=1
MGKGRLNPHKIIRAARARGLFVLISGQKYDFWDARTGKPVLTFYADRKFWFMPGAGDRKGDAEDCEAAIVAAFGEVVGVPQGEA